MNKPIEITDCFKTDVAVLTLKNKEITKNKTMDTAKKSSLKGYTRIIALVSGILLILAVFFPLWQMELTAPQYPEGLEMAIYPNKIDGEVKIINGLNHYIGMKELHEEDFKLEFIGIPIALYVLGALGLIVALINRRFLFFTWVSLFLIFGVLAAADFWYWLYQYGHNLDPTAPIQVPGMTYQPPMIGFKQLLNFGIYSELGIGGIMLVTVGGLMVVASFFELKKKKVKTK